jgi:glycosyltransferase involved in cell wall biosynthesis
VPDLSPASGGQSAAAIALSTGLIEAGLELDLVTTNHELDGTASVIGGGLHPIACVFPRWRWAPEAVRTLRPLLSRAQLVHIHGLWLYPIWRAARLCRQLGIAYLVSPCGMLEEWSLAQHAWRKRLYAVVFERHTLNGAAAIHFTSDGEYERSRTLGSQAPACVVPLGLPRSAWEHLPPRGNFKGRVGLGDRLVVLFLGRLHAKKQPELLLEAFAEIAGEWPNASLVLAGPSDASYLLRLKTLARTLRIDERVRFPGLLIGSAVQEALVDADVFALPSLQENFALAVAEAMAAGCPVIVSPSVALAPEIANHRAGLVVPAGPAPLADALRQMLQDQAGRAVMGGNGRRLILRSYTSERAAHQMIDIYTEILQGSRQNEAWRA